MIDVSTETLTRLVAAKFPSRPHKSTIWRWALCGVRGVKLETVVCGGVRFTSAEAIQRFLSALNCPGAVPEPANAAAERAGLELERMGC